MGWPKYEYDFICVGDFVHSCNRLLPTTQKKREIAVRNTRSRTMLKSSTQPSQKHQSGSN